MIDRVHCENSTEFELRLRLNPSSNNNFLLFYILEVHQENSHSNDSLRPLPGYDFVQLKQNMFVLILYQ